MKQRSRSSQLEREGVLGAASKCNALGLIWRDILQEDVGVDATVELLVNGFPTGKLVGIQVKSGNSYIRSESQDSFKFYPSADDLEYWRGLTLPLILLVFDPSSKQHFWLDVQRHMENRAEDPLGTHYLLFDKKNVVNDDFVKYLATRFDLVIYSPAQFATVRTELEELVYEDPQLGGESARISALDLFVNGLWGLCSKVQWHLTLLTESIREQLMNRTDPSLIKYDLSRPKLFPFLNGYFAALGRHHLAILDYEDLNYTLYTKLEWPAFVAPLTVNGRRFVEYLRYELEGTREVRDKQYFSLQRYPHTQIEIYSSYEVRAGSQTFGPYLDVISIQFNRYLDYYFVVHFTRPKGAGRPELRLQQMMFYYELTNYLEHILRKTPKNNVVCREQDMLISPLICWLERFLEFEHGISSDLLAMRPPSTEADFAQELMTILSPGAIATTQFAQTVPNLHLLRLANGEPLSGEY